MGSTPLLSLPDLLAPHSLHDLQTTHWGRHAVAMPGPSSRVAAWRHAKGWRSWVLHDLHAATREPDGTQQREAITPADIEQALAEGQTICGNASRDPRLRRVLADLAAHEAASDDDPFAKLYVSPPGRGYVLHADRYHVLVVQLSGRKRWWYSEQPAVSLAPAGAFVDAHGDARLTHPYQGLPMLADDGRPVRPPTDDALSQVVLGPGDCLYLPPGTWHRTESLSTSAALSLSPPRRLPTERLSTLVNRALLTHPQLRSELWSGDPTAVLDDQLTRLRALLDDLDARSLYRSWAIEHEQRLASLDPPNTVEPPTLAPDDTIERAGHRPLRWLVAPDEDGDDALFFYGAGQEWSLPLEARPLVEAIAATPRFTLRDARTFAPGLEPEDIDAVLGELITAGVLLRSST